MNAKGSHLACAGSNLRFTHHQQVINFNKP